MGKWLESMESLPRGLVPIMGPVPACLEVWGQIHRCTFGMQQLWEGGEHLKTASTPSQSSLLSCQKGLFLLESRI